MSDKPTEGITTVKLATEDGESVIVKGLFGDGDDALLVHGTVEVEQHDQPTELDLLKLELRDLLTRMAELEDKSGLQVAQLRDSDRKQDASLGELRMNLTAMFRRLAAMEARLRKVEARPSVGIQGLDDLPAIVARDAALKLDAEIMTVTPVPEWEA